MYLYNLLISIYTAVVSDFYDLPPPYPKILDPPLKLGKSMHAMFTVFAMRQEPKSEAEKFRIDNEHTMQSSRTIHTEPNFFVVRTLYDMLGVIL